MSTRRPGLGFHSTHRSATIAAAALWHGSYHARSMGAGGRKHKAWLYSVMQV
jgi:hypothetical protein